MSNLRRNPLAALFARIRGQADFARTTRRYQRRNLNLSFPTAIEFLEDRALLSSLIPTFDARDVSLTTNEDQSVNFSINDLLANDDLEVGVTEISRTNPGQGTLVEVAPGEFRYSPNADFSGTDSFTYSVERNPAFSTILQTPTGEIPISGFSWNTHTSLTFSPPSGPNVSLPTLENLHLTTRMSEAAPGLSSAVALAAQDSLIENMTLRHLEPSGRLTEWNLEKVQVVSANFASEDDGTTLISLELSYDKLTHTLTIPGKTSDDEADVLTFGYDQTKYQSIGNDPGFGGEDFDHEQVPLILVTPSGEIAVENSSWSVERDIVRDANGVDRPAPQFDSFHLTTRMSKASPGLFYALATGTPIPQMTLSQQEPSGQLTEWLLENVYVTSLDFETEDDGTSIISFELEYQKVLQTVTAPGGGNSLSTGYDRSIQKNLPGTEKPPLGNVDGVGEHPLILATLTGEIAIEEISWNIQNNGSIGDNGASKPEFKLRLSTRMSETSPGLLYQILTSSGQDMMLYQQESFGRLTEWTLNDVLVLSLKVETEVDGTQLVSFELDFGDFGRLAQKVTRLDPFGARTEFRFDYNIATNAPMSSDAGFGGEDFDHEQVSTILVTSSGEIAIEESSWFIEKDTNIDGGNPSFPQFGRFHLTTRMLESSPGLFYALATGTPIPQMTLSQQDPSGLLTEWTLEHVVVVSLNIDTEIDGTSIISFELDYETIEQTVTRPGPGDPISTGYDRNIEQTFGDKPSFGVKNLPPDETPLMLVADSGAITVEGNFWDLQNSTTIGSSGDSASKPQFGNLRLSTRISAASPGLFYAVATGIFGSKMTLFQREPSGLLTEWQLMEVQIVSMKVDTAIDGTQLISFELHYKTLEQKVTIPPKTGEDEADVLMFGYDQTKNEPIDPDPGFGEEDFDREQEPTILVTPSGEIAVEASSWFIEGNAIIGTNGQSNPKLGGLHLTTPMSKSAPGLFHAVATGTILPQMTLSRLEPSGLLEEWILENVVVVSLEIDTDDDGTNIISFELDYERLQQIVTVPGETEPLSFSFDRARLLPKGNIDFGKETFVDFVLRDTATVNIHVTPVNDPPVFTLASDPNSMEDSGPQTVTNFATNIAPGPTTATDEQGQMLTFVTTVLGTTGNLAFAAEPFIDPSTGALTYATLPNSNGTATVSVILRDEEGAESTTAAPLQLPFSP